MSKLESKKDTLKFSNGARIQKIALETIDGQRSLGALQRSLRTSQPFPVHGQRAAASCAAVAGGSPETCEKFHGLKTKI